MHGRGSLLCLSHSAHATASHFHHPHQYERPTINAAVAAYLSTRHRDDPASGCPLAAIGSELSRMAKKTREAATEGLKRLVEVLAGKSETQDARRRALVAVATMIGAVTMSRVVTDPGLSAEILREAEKSLVAARS